MENRSWITGLRGILITTYIGHRHLSSLPKERRHWGLPSPISEAQAELAGLVSTHISDGNSARKMGSEKETTRGISLSRNWSDFFIFQVCLYTFLLYIGMNTESCGGQQTWPLSQPGASYKIIQRSYGFDIIFWPWDLLTFYGPFWYRSVNQKTYFSRGDFFLNQSGATLQIKLHSYRVRV